MRTAPMLSHIRQLTECNLDGRTPPRHRLIEAFSLPSEPLFIEIHGEESFDATTGHLAFGLHL
jgi:hypothetical protein